MHHWKVYVSNVNFRKSVILGVITLSCILIFFPHFFQYIEKRNGYALNDLLLPYLPALNLSWPIFIIIWLMAALTIYRCLQSPAIMLTFLWSYIFLCVSRIITIYFIPLAPPGDLIVLQDPISNQFYGESFVTKDLFFSGHVSTQFLMFLCLQKKYDKILTALSTLSIAIMVLIQRVHYTIDVLAAIPLTYFIFVAAKYFIHRVLKSFANLKV
jgi:hypothetical protein